jgi:lysozyme family protein
MADYKNIIPFIRAAEGGWVNNPSDPGGETNAGVTYAVWCTFFGNDSHDRFMTMSDDDWGTIFKTGYWDKIMGDSINSQRIGNILVDWTWGSGTYYPGVDVQDILDKAFGEHLTEDGSVGPATIAAINEVDEQTLWDDIVAKRFSFLDAIVANNSSLSIFLQGWKNRMNNLIKFENDQVS